MITLPNPPHLSLYVPEKLIDLQTETITIFYPEKLQPKKSYNFKKEVEQWCNDTLSGKFEVLLSDVFVGLSNEKQIPMNIKQWEVKFEKISDLIIFRFKWIELVSDKQDSFFELFLI